MTEKYPRKGFIVEEITESCGTEGCTAGKLVVLSWEYRGEEVFNDLTNGLTVGQYSKGTDYEGACYICGKPVVYDDYFVVTEDANAAKKGK